MADARMVDGRQHLRFPTTSGQPFRMMRKGVRQDLDAATRDIKIPEAW